MATPRIAFALVALCLAAVCATSAPAAGTANDPLKLALQRSDFPPELSRYSNKRFASIERSLAAAGFEAKAADYAAEISRGSADTLYVSGRVIVLPSPAEARRLFARYRREDPAVAAKLAKPLRLRRFGEEQSAFTDPWNRSDLRVRTGSVVWRVEIKYGGIEEKLTRAQSIAELERYATKLKVRVGRG